MIKTSVARIGRVRMKSGGADVRILDNPVYDSDGMDLLKDARILAEIQNNRICGYAIVTWDKKGYTGTAVKYGDINNRFMPPDSIPHFVHDRLSGFMRRRDMID